MSCHKVRRRIGQATTPVQCASHAAGKFLARDKLQHAELLMNCGRFNPGWHMYSGAVPRSARLQARESLHGRHLG